MNTYAKLLCLGALAAAIAVPSTAFATVQCDDAPVAPTQNVSFGTLNLPSFDVPVGTILAERMTLPWNPPAFSCMGPAWHYAPHIGLEYLGQPAASGAAADRTVYKTNVPGVGIRIAFESADGHRVMAGDADAPAQAPRNIWVPPGVPMPVPAQSGRFRVQLIKTGEIPRSATLPNGPLANLTLVTANSPQHDPYGPVQASITLSDSHIVVPMPAQP